MAQVTKAQLRKLALGLEDVEEGVACEGTPLEKRTMKVRGRAFLFLGETDLMVKLDASIADATARAAKKPELLKVGKAGWVTVKHEARVPVRTLESWIEESHALMARNGGRDVASGAKAASGTKRGAGTR